MRRLLRLALFAGIAVGGAQGQGAGKVSLQEALNRMLGDGCRGSGASGLLKSSELVTTSASTYSNPTATFTYAGFDQNQRQVPIFTGATVNENNLPPASGDLTYANPWRSAATAPISVTASLGQGAGSAPVVNVSVALAVQGVLTDSTGAPVRGADGRLQAVPKQAPCTLLSGGASFCNEEVEGDPFPGFVPRVQNASFNPATDPEIFRFQQASRVDVVVTPSWTVTT
jgi:hypothetical protein